MKSPARQPKHNETRCNHEGNSLWCQGQTDHGGPHFHGSLNLPEYWSDRPNEDLLWLSEYIRRLSLPLPNLTKRGDRELQQDDIREAARMLRAIILQLDFTKKYY